MFNFVQSHIYSLRNSFSLTLVQQKGKDFQKVYNLPKMIARKNRSVKITWNISTNLWKYEGFSFEFMAAFKYQLQNIRRYFK